MYKNWTKHTYLKAEFINFDGLYGDISNTEIEEFINLEPLAIRSKRNNWIIKPHFHRLLHQIFILEKGSGTILFENNHIEFVGPCIISIPQNIQHGFKFSPEILGTVVTFSSNILERSFQLLPEIKLEFGQIKVYQFASIDPQFKQILGYILLLKNELSISLVGHNIMKNNNLTSVLIEIFRVFRQSNQALITQKNRSLNLFYSFQKGIVTYRNPQKNIKDYASQMNISALHLNRICKEIYQKNASTVVADYFIAEAKKYLSYTDYSITEIAHQLNFNDPAYFSRFFKKWVGFCPKSFRKSSKNVA